MWLHVGPEEAWVILHACSSKGHMGFSLRVMGKGAAIPWKTLNP